MTAVLVVSDPVAAVRATRTALDAEVVVAVLEPGRPDERPREVRPVEVAPPLRAAVSRTVGALSGTAHRVLRVPFRDGDDAELRTRRRVAAVAELCRRLRARRVVVDEQAFWEPGAGRLADRLQDEAADGRLGGTVVEVTRTGDGGRAPTRAPVRTAREQRRPLRRARRRRSIPAGGGFRRAGSGRSPSSR